MNEPALMKFGLNEKTLYLYVNPEENMFLSGSCLSEIKLRVAASNPAIDICTDTEDGDDAVKDLNLGLDLMSDARIAERGEVIKSIVSSILQSSGATDDNTLKQCIDAVFNIAICLKSCFESAAVISMLMESGPMFSKSSESMARMIITSDKYVEWKDTFKVKMQTEWDGGNDQKVHREFVSSNRSNPKFANWRI